MNYSTQIYTNKNSFNKNVDSSKSDMKIVVPYGCEAIVYEIDSHVSHTLGGFKGAFTVENGTRPPAEQEIFDAGVRSGMERVKKESGWRDMDGAPKDGTEVALLGSSGSCVFAHWNEYGWVPDGVSGSYEMEAVNLDIGNPVKWMHLPPAPKE